MRLAPLAVVVALSLPSAASAAGLTQPNGAAVPAPMGCSGGKPTGLLPVMACACTQAGVCNIGAACPGGSTSCDDGQHGTCETTLWHSPNDNSCIPSNQSGLDPATQAAVLPETFHPTCGQTFTLLSRGTSLFENVFGWYNAGTVAPDPSDLHAMIACGDAPGKVVTLDVTSDPSYKGGDIGFFLLTPEDHTKGGTCASGTSCCPTVATLQSGAGYVYYSQREFDPDVGYIHLLNLPGTIAPNRFYFAWEDTFQTTSADFTDLVAAVDGVQCSGAGQACETGKLGSCAAGITTCAPGATTPTCQQVEQPQPETCNGLDDDCDGQIDNGATCSTPGWVCVNAQCVPPCSSIEFPCSGDEACDPTTRVCIDPKCVGVTGAGGQVCYGGTCTTPCQGVTCPAGETCEGDACVDLCKGVSCAAGQLCKEGICFDGCAACGGVTCAAPLACDAASGACTDPSCPNGCPTGTVCSSGQCVDGCTGVVCPHGQACSAGNCVAAGLVDAGGGGLVEPTGPSGNGSLDGADGGAANGDQAGPNITSHACACSLRPSSPARTISEALLAALALAGAVARRRSRHHDVAIASDRAMFRAPTWRRSTSRSRSRYSSR